MWRLFLSSRGDRVVAGNGLVALRYWNRVLIWIHFKGEISVIFEGGDLVCERRSLGQLGGICPKQWKDVVAIGWKREGCACSRCGLKIGSSLWIRRE